MRRVFVVAVLGLGLVQLSACDSLRQAAGLTKTSPDEFAVVTKAPLIVPPDFNLKPPQPGAAPLNQQDPTEAAQTALFASNDPETTARSIPGSFTMGERMLMAYAGVQKADPAIRAELQSDQKNMQGADDSFTDRVLAGSLSPQPAAARPAPKPKSSGGWFSGWFDWL